MARWTNDSKGRLVDAAMALFEEHGYGATNIAEVAKKAGVSERTFFRHFTDKEEVLFATDDDLLPLVLECIASGPTGTPRQMLAGALVEMSLLLEPQRAFLKRRAIVIGSDVGLVGREFAKQYRWAGAIGIALRDRGYSDHEADLFAAIGFAIFRESISRWLDAAEPASLSSYVEGTLEQSSALFS